MWKKNDRLIFAFPGSQAIQGTRDFKVSAQTAWLKPRPFKTRRGGIQTWRTGIQNENLCGEFIKPRPIKTKIYSELSSADLEDLFAGGGDLLRARGNLARHIEEWLGRGVLRPGQG